MTIDIGQLTIAYWFLLLPTLVLPALVIVRHRRRRQRETNNLCPTCGYDLRATPDPLLPGMRSRFKVQHWRRVGASALHSNHVHDGPSDPSVGGPPPRPAKKLINNPTIPLQ